MKTSLETLDFEIWHIHKRNCCWWSVPWIPYRFYQVIVRWSNGQPSINCDPIASNQIHVRFRSPDEDQWLDLLQEAWNFETKI